MRGVIFHDEIDVEFARHGGLDRIEELAKLRSTVASVALANEPPSRNVEGGEQRWSAVSGVVMASSGRLGRDASAASADCGPAPEFGTSHPHIERWRTPAVRCKGPQPRALWPRRLDRSRA